VAANPERWDIFCRVVDNYGDVGVAWRLARCLAREQGKRVRLVLDDLTVLAHLRPETDPSRDAQRLDAVDIRKWPQSWGTPGSVPREEVAEVVVETFGCDAPEAYVLAMAAREPLPRWINLEYLSAEPWVEGSHALPSPHPRLAPLTRHFFFPGFTGRTGGLLRERDLLSRRDAFQSDRGAQGEFWRALTGSVPAEGALKVSLFGYSGAPYLALLQALAHHAGPVWLAVPEGAASAALAAHLGHSATGARPSLQAFAVPFLDQDRYDELLWACDVNFVRGEDSFVRAQWAARPFAWHAYPQAAEAHRVKLEAFLDRYAAGLDGRGAAATRRFFRAWNGAAEAGPIGDAWLEFVAERPQLHTHGTRWCAELARLPDLASGLVAGAEDRV
jgi:uncharacterized repeat protein (TIGR03837 family)